MSEMTCIRQTYLDQQWLEPRKGPGTTACLEKAQSRKVVVAAAGQDKACIAKAGLPEPQSPVILRVMASQNDWRGASDSPRASKGLRTREPTCPAHLPSGRARRRTGRLPTPHLSSCAITGCPAAGIRETGRPVWARSRHSTQTPGAMSGTADAATLSDGRVYKAGATRPKAPPTGGRAAVFTTEPSNDGVC